MCYLCLVVGRDGPHEEIVPTRVEGHRQDPCARHRPRHGRRPALGGLNTPVGWTASLPQGGLMIAMRAHHAPRRPAHTSCPPPSSLPSPVGMCAAILHNHTISVSSTRSLCGRFIGSQTTQCRSPMQYVRPSLHVHIGRDVCTRRQERRIFVDAGFCHTTPTRYSHAERAARCGRASRRRWSRREPLSRRRRYSHPLAVR